MDKYKDIRAYRVGWILAVIDWFTVLPILKIWALRTTKGIRMEYLGERKQIERDIKHGAFFLTNHRDIILDAAWLSYRLRLRYFIRPFMGVGNNLFAKPWIEHLMRFMRCFVVKRGEGVHAQLENAKQLSAYIRMLRSQGKSIWLAQREGRAKDSNDLTQASVLHMLTLGDDDFFENVKALNICPVSITYEFDPCDYLKAAEMQLKRDNPKWRKSKRDDVKSMQTGIRGEKGRVVYRLTPSINPEIEALLANEPEWRTAPIHDQLQRVCDIIDRHIHQGYEIFNRGTEFDAYIESRLAMIDIPNKDEAFLRDKLYEMYNNPVINYKKAYE
ncbi:MAG: 1-acyl-sn-glycerol-3-phosphate acyltransferase [Paludibacteraceae bacterium]|nr:1-acyl-sn-glycerol-3-phosphate acyltransferase [Paludibacteraceae bacterium]MDD6747598.1 1-acyl-sn-glycerol-3-phosphate acyltransferase [Paludibacteraceae bacterium]